MKTYQENQIDELSVKEMTDGTLMLTVMPIMETLYSCPGAVIEEKDGTTLVGLVRCRMSKKCFVDVVATPNPSKPGSYDINLPRTGNPVKVDYDSGATQVWP